MSGIISALELIISTNSGQAITGVRAVGREVRALEKELDAVGNGGLGISKAAAQIERETARIEKAKSRLAAAEEDSARRIAVAEESNRLRDVGATVRGVEAEARRADQLSAIAERQVAAERAFESTRASIAQRRIGGEESLASRLAAIDDREYTRKAAALSRRLDAENRFYDQSRIRNQLAEIEANIFADRLAAAQARVVAAQAAAGFEQTANGRFRSIESGAFVSKDVVESSPGVVKAMADERILLERQQAAAIRQTAAEDAEAAAVARARAEADVQAAEASIAAERERAAAKGASAAKILELQQAEIANNERLADAQRANAAQVVTVNRNADAAGALRDIDGTQRATALANLTEAERIELDRKQALASAEVSAAEAERARLLKLTAAAQGEASRAQVIANGIARNGLIGLSVAVLGSVAVASKFDETMRNVNSIQIEAGESAGASAKRFKEQSDAIVELSRNIPQSANSLAEGLYEIASSGFQGADGLHVLEVAAKAATAGVSDTDTAAKAIVSVLNTFGLSAASAGDVSDTLFQTVKDGVIRFDELATALNYSVNAASTAGISYGEMGAALATLTRNGVQGARSGVIFANVVAKIIAPSKELLALFRANGFESGAAALDQLKFAGVLELIRNATGGAAGGLSQLFHEQRAFRGVASLIANDGKTLAEEMDRIGTATGRAGATQRTFQEQMKATANRIRVAINQIAGDAIKIGQAFLPTVEAVVAVLAKLTDVLSSNRAAIVVLGALMAGQLAKGYVSAGLGALGLARNAAAATVALQGQAAAATTAATATTFASRALGTLATGGAILALGLIAKGFYDVKQAGNEAIESVRTGLDLNTTSGLAKELERIKQLTQDIFETEKKRSVLSSIADDITNPFGGSDSAKSFEQLKRLLKEAEAARKQMERIGVVADAVGAKLGVTFAPGTDALANFQRNVTAAAKSLEIDLSKPITTTEVTKLAKALGLVVAGVGELPDALGRTGQEFEAFTEQIANTTVEVEKFADTAEKAFSQDFKIEAGFTLDDPADIQQKIDAVEQKLADKAQEQKDVLAARDEERRKRDADKKIKRAEADLAAIGALNDKFQRTYEGDAILTANGNKPERESNAKGNSASLERRRQKAQERLDDLREARDNPKVNPGDARRDARARVEVRELQKELKALKDLQLPDAPSKAYQKKLDADLALLQKFPKLYADAVARGLNEVSLAEILELGPAKGADVLNGLLSDSTNKTIDNVNDFKKRVAGATDSVRELARIRSLAFTPVQGDEPGALDRRKAEFKTATSISSLLSNQPAVGPKLTRTAIAKLLGITPAEVDRVAKDFAIAITPGVIPDGALSDFGKTALKDGENAAKGIRDYIVEAAGTTFNNLPNIFGTKNPANETLPTAGTPVPVPLVPKYVAPLPPTAFFPPTTTTRVPTQPSQPSGAGSTPQKTVDNSITINAEKIDYADMEKMRAVQLRKASLTGRRS